MTAPALSPVTDLAETRLLRDMAALAQAERRVAELRAKVSAGCRAWSDARGYRVILRPEQILREIGRESVIPLQETGR